MVFLACVCVGGGWGGGGGEGGGGGRWGGGGDVGVRVLCLINCDSTRTSCSRQNQDDHNYYSRVHLRSCGFRWWCLGFTDLDLMKA